ncbi:hypothetical protein H0H81_000776 [Sphagnurus paluster]|uniref:LysM domain-containing protein n=1 Tax=Sphagnurus paluster TaxID=117069 RepID=A0A9P7GP25_9AGAR|nr:hypothetical protein H0H81_000776 [Sphagnurus paluster]
MKDEDTFVLGDDSDFEDEKEEDPTTALDADSAFQDISNSFESKALHQATPSLTSVDMKLPELQKDEQRVADALPVKYQINRSDTLQGIVLRYGLDAYELCRLNNLPPSTLKTTPHVLHTRRFLIFPLNTGRTEFLLNNETPDRVREREARRGKERAEKRLQMLTKEADWRVAKAYVAIADDLAAEAEKTEEWHRERKEYAGDNAPVATVRPLNLEERAIMKYLDDNEWEEAQRREWSRRR